MTFNNEKYSELLVKTLPRVIDSPEEYDRLEKIFEELFDSDRSAEEDSLFDLLANLLEDYEEKTLPLLDTSTPLDSLTFLMNENKLKQKDLVEIFGTQSIVSEVLNAKREISKTAARRLAGRFGVSAELFI